jgi:hypothetical protein
MCPAISAKCQSFALPHPDCALRYCRPVLSHLLQQEDVHTVMLPGVGTLTHLGVRLDGSGQHPAWHLEKVCLQQQAPRSSPNHHQQQQQQHEGVVGPAVWFSAQRWLDAVRGLEVLLPAQAEDPAMNLVPYQVQVYTSDTK